MPHGVPTIHVAPLVKPWWASKVLWLNTVAAVLLAAEASFQLLQPLLPVNFYAVFSFGLALANAGLRIITTMGLQFRAAQGAAE